MKPSLSAGPSTDTSLSGYATKRNDYPATLLKEAGACFPSRSLVCPSPTLTNTGRQQANGPTACPFCLESHSENRQSGEFFLFQGVGGSGGEGQSTADSGVNLQAPLQQRSSVQAGPAVCLVGGPSQFSVVQRPAENGRSRPCFTRKVNTWHVGALTG